MAMEENKTLTANEQLERLIDMALVDGILTDKEREVIIKKAQTLGIDADEAEMILEAKVYELGGNSNKDSNVSYNSEESISNYQKEFDKIKNQEFRPIGQVIFLRDKRYKYKGDDREKHSRIETERIKDECCAFIDSIYPTNQVETIDALNFLSRFLPSPSISELVPKISLGKRVYNYDRAYTKKAVLKLKTIIKESEDDFSDNVRVMNKVKVVKEKMGLIVNTLEVELERAEDLLANLDEYFEGKLQTFKNNFKAYRIKRCIRWGIFGITLAAAWLLAGYGWGWSVAINVLTIGAWGFWYMVVGNDFTEEYQRFRKRKPNSIRKANKGQELKDTIKFCKDEIALFKL